MDIDPTTTLSLGQANKLAVLLDALEGVVISDVPDLADQIRGAHRGEHRRGDRPGSGGRACGLSSRLAHWIFVSQVG